MAAKKRKYQDILVFMLLYVWSLVLLSFCNGCESNRNELSLRPDVPLAWPAPPEKSRIRYLGVISTEADLKAKVSWTQGLGELLFGKSKIGVLVAPSAVAIDQSDRLFVTDSAGAAVHVFDLNKRTYKQFADLAGQEKLLKPVGLTNPHSATIKCTPVHMQRGRRIIDDYGNAHEPAQENNFVREVWERTRALQNEIDDLLEHL